MLVPMSLSGGTLRVTNRPKILDHVPANPNDSKEVKFSNEKIGTHTSDTIDPDASVQNFLLS
jgi:hypothetical protein